MKTKPNIKIASIQIGNIALTMNILKNSRVLNRNCLRDKIKNLSPLLRALDFGPPNKDSVFRATWSYYASDCQERLSNIRRRIEQNARVLAPRKAPLSVDLEIPCNENQLPGGLDLDEHIYQELVSCFRNAESSDSIKKTTTKRLKPQRFLNMGKFSTPEQWISWKREEQQVDQLLKKSFDPYLKEEMSKKLQHLQKLIQRRPLILIPTQEETIEKQKESMPKKRKSRQISIDNLKKSDMKIGDIYKKYSINTPTKSVNFNSGEGPIKSVNENKSSINSSKKPKSLRKKNSKNSRSIETNFKDSNSEKEDLPFGKSFSKSAMSLRKPLTSLADRYQPSSVNLRKKSSSKIGDKYKTTTNLEDLNSRITLTKMANENKLTINLRKKATRFADKYKPTSGNSLLNRFIADHPSLESVASSRRSTKTIESRPRPRRIEKPRNSSDADDGIYGTDDQGDSLLMEKDKLINSENLEKDPESKISTTVIQRKSHELKKIHIPEELTSLSQISDIHSSSDTHSKKSIFKESLLLKTPTEEHKTEDLRQGFVSQKKSQSLTNLQALKANEYIHDILKGLTQTDSSFIGGLKDKYSGSAVSIYKRQFANDIKNQESKREVVSGDHHGWYINVKQHLSIVNKMRPIIFKKKQQNEVVSKHSEIVPSESLEITPFRETLIGIPSDKTPNSSTYSKNSDDEIRLSFPSKPLVISNLIADFIDSYGSEISFLASYPDLFKPNDLEKFQMKTIFNKKKVKKHKKPKVKEVMEVKKVPSKRLVCSLCNLVRRRQSELRPYMQRMQKRRQQLELKNYYTQNFLKCRRNPQQHAQEQQKKVRTREILSKYCKALDICQEIVELRIQKRSEECPLG
ncbi:uncharacterized protein [Drosophila takahashii]|uniref:uncharacterized protein n=1 Tax=Drosophila takahashii TaxID=29030 RepID=UPI0038990EAE